MNWNGRELFAAIRLADVDRAMKMAADSLRDIGSDEARQHAQELLGAAKMVRQWELELRRMKG